MSGPAFNGHGVWAIYRFEMARFLRTLLQSVLTPVITTSLFVIVFGAAIGSRMAEVGGVSYGAGVREPKSLLEALEGSDTAIV